MDEAFLVACKTGNVNLIELSLKAGADINYEEGKGLINACENFHLDAIKYLIDNGIHVNPNEIVNSMLETIKEYRLDEDTIDMYAGKFYTACDASVDKFWKILKFFSKHGLFLSELNKKVLLSLLLYVDEGNIHRINFDEVSLTVSYCEIVDDYISKRLGFDSPFINFVIDNHIDILSQSQLVKLIVFYPCDEKVNKILDFLEHSMFSETDSNVWKDAVKQLIGNGHDGYNPRLEKLLTYIDAFEEFPINIEVNYSNIFFRSINVKSLEMIWQKCSISEENLMNYYNKVSERFKKNPTYFGLRSIKEFIENKVKELLV